MKLKKIGIGMLSMVCAGMLLTACGGSKDSSDSTKETKEATSTTKEAAAATKTAGGDLQDGTYQLEEKNYENDYRAVFSIVVKDGKITKSDYDNVNKDGSSKTKDTDYEKNMKAKSGVGPAEYTKQLNAALEKEQDPSNVEVVTGATHSSESFQNYAQQLIQAAQAGKTDKIEIDNGADLQDGTYKLEEKNYSNGYRTVFSITVAGGKITESNFDAVNEAGKSKTVDADYEKNMKAKSGIGPVEYMKQLNAALVEKQAPADVEVVTGATHSSHSFILYAQQLINAAEKGDTTTITVDNMVYSE